MSLFNWPLLVTAILLGMGLGIQAPINAWIGKRLGSPYWGAGFSISISSGGAQNAETGAKMLKTMQQEFQSRFRMIAAGSITSENLLSLHHKIEFSEYHGRKIVGDLARSSNPS